MKGFFESTGLSVSVWAMALWGLPTAWVAFGAMWWRCRRWDRRVARAATETAGAEGKGGL